MAGALGRASQSREKGGERRGQCVAGALGRASHGRIAVLNGSPLQSDHALLPTFFSLISTSPFSLWRGQ